MTSKPGTAKEEPNTWTQGGQAKSSDVAYTTLSSRRDVEIVERLTSLANGSGSLVNGRANRGYTKPTPWPSK